MANEFSKIYSQGREIVQTAPQLYIDLDVESDGIAGYGSLLSIGAISPWGETFYRELRPSSDIWIPGNREFCEAHGLQRERLVDEGTKGEQAIAELHAWQQELRERYQKRGAVLVAFNASYDFPLIDLEFKRAQIENPFGVAGYCIKSLAMKLSENYDWRATQKSNLPHDIKPAKEFTHNALEDAEYQQQLHFAMIGKLARQAADS